MADGGSQQRKIDFRTAVELLKALLPQSLSLKLSLITRRGFQIRRGTDIVGPA
jgi:hypothetical protein